jgi:HK97 family phage prohead protease
MRTPTGALAFPEKRYAAMKLTRTPTDGKGIVWALASTFDWDRDDERFAHGAWVESVLEWKMQETDPPCFVNHQVRDLNSLVGRVIDLQETNRGLEVVIKLDLTSSLGQLVYEKVLVGDLQTLSVGFIVHQRDPRDVGIITKAELLEVSFTPTPANPAARVLDVKTHSTGSTSSTVTCMNTPTDPASDPRAVLKQLDAIAAEVRPRPRTGKAVDVDAFVAQVREEMVREKLAEAEQGVWERSQVNVIDPVPVVVDARMRPVRS